MMQAKNRTLMIRLPAAGRDVTPACRRPVHQFFINNSITFQILAD
jgi:hypothetical protein